MSQCVSEFYLHVCVKVDGTVESTKIEGPAPVAESSIPKEEFTFTEYSGELEKQVFSILRRRYTDLLAPNLNRNDSIYRPRGLADAVDQFPHAPVSEIVRLVDVRLQNYYMQNVARGLKVDEFPTREGKAKVLRSTATLGAYVLRLLREAGELTQLES